MNEVLGWILALVFMVLWLGRVAKQWLAKLERDNRRHEGALGETRARQLLERAGYQVLEEQPWGQTLLSIDGAEHAFSIRADYLVRKGSRDYIAEVKTGRVAPQLSCAETRRQLLEYALHYDVDGVLLVDASKRRIANIHFHNAP